MLVYLLLCILVANASESHEQGWEKKKKSMIEKFCSHVQDLVKMTTLNVCSVVVVIVGSNCC